MDNWEKINAAGRMQDYIHQNIDTEITLENLCKAAGYSKWHSLRIFKELFKKTPFEYIRAFKLTNAARSIRADSGVNILNVAVDNGFSSHEGFTKAFHNYFGVNPKKYSRYEIPLRYMYFEPSSILRYYQLKNSKEYNDMCTTPRTVTVTVIEKPACKLILWRGIKSTDYFSYCAEMGCDKWEILQNIPRTFNQSFVVLPPNMIKQGTSMAAVVVEAPDDFNSDIPDGCDIIDLPAHIYMLFQGAPYEDENWYGEAHWEVDQAIANYKPELYGYEFAKDSAPCFYYGASAANGCKVIIPVRRISTK